jgi:hypothetical protein
MDGDGDEGDNVEVEGSHMGLPWNPQVLAIVAERLARVEVPVAESRATTAAS